MLDRIGSVFSFLTVLPAPPGSLDDAARWMWLFPVAGIAVGLLAGLAGFGLSEVADPLLVGMLVVTLLAVVTGLHHADGLADLADGLMAGGTRGSKLRAMRDQSVGSAGAAALVLYIVGMVIVVSLTGGHEALFRAVLVSEVLAKFSMVLVAAMGSPAAAAPGGGTATSAAPFMHAMRDRRRLVAALAITAVPVVLAGGATGLVMMGAAVAVSMIMLAVSTRSFGGITGDVMGATNEIVRLASLAVFVTI